MGERTGVWGIPPVRSGTPHPLNKCLHQFVQERDDTMKDLLFTGGPLESPVGVLYRNFSHQVLIPGKGSWVQGRETEDGTL